MSEDDICPECGAHHEEPDLVLSMSIDEPSLRVLIATASFAYCELLGDDHPQQSERHRTREFMLDVLLGVGGLPFLQQVVATIQDGMVEITREVDGF